MPIFLRYRLSKGKEDKKRLYEKLGCYQNNLTSHHHSHLIRIHGASIGETVSGLAIIEHIKQYYPDLPIMVTSNTKTSAELMKKRLPSGCFHVYAPLDTPQAIARFYRRYQPKMEIILDSEIWPNAVHYAAKQNIPVYGVNTRLSKKSIQLWQKFPKLLNSTLSCYTNFFVQNQETSDFIKSYYKGSIAVNENLKWAFTPPDFDRIILECLKVQCRNRFIFCLLSTHAPEEQEITNALVKVGFFKDPRNLLLIVPRHPSRKQEIIENLPVNIIHVCRSDNPDISNETQIYIADTLNEMMLWFHISDMTFVGHSLSHDGGGHNPIEPAHLGQVICVGSKYQNFDEIYKIFKENDACIFSDDAYDLVHKVIILKSKPELCQRLRHNSRKLCSEYRKKLIPLFDDLTQKVQEIYHASP